MKGILQDIHYALRQLRRSPKFAALSIATLALGIGAATAMFSLIDRVIFRSLPYPHDQRLASVGVVAPIIDGEFLFAGNYLEWKQQQRAFAGFSSSSGVSDCDLTEEHPVRLACAAVDSSFLSTFEIQPLLGRNFNPQEDRPNAAKVALISYPLWQDRFAAERSVLGRNLSIDGQQTEIIGVLPRDFEFPTLAHTDLLIPQALDESIVARHILGGVVRVFGRTKPGQTIEQAKAELQPQFNSFVQMAPPEFRKVLRLEVRSIRDLQIHDSRRAAWLLLLSALAVLAIACANAANLALARSAARRQDLAVRAALGAGRVRLFRQRLIESLMLALFGCIAGTALASVIVHIFVALAPAGIPRLSQASVDVRILGIALVLSLLSGILFGTAPALERPTQMLSVNIAAGVRQGRLRQALLVAQVCSTVILLTSALLFVRSLRNLQTQPLGINTQNIVTANFTLGQQKYATAKQRLAFFEELESKVRGLPGIGSAALADSIPPKVPPRTMPFFALQAEGQPPLSISDGIGGVVAWRSVTPDYFSVLGMSLLRGRAFGEQDRAPASHVIMVNQTLARRLFGNEEALGKTIRFHTDRDALSAPFTVIGITANTQNQGLGGEAGPEYYMVRRHTENDVVFNYPDSQRITILARSAMQSDTVQQQLRQAVAMLDPTVPVEVSTLGQTISRMAERPRFSAALLSFLAAVGLLLTAVGIYGVVSLLVNQRTQEIGIRMALGASRQHVIGMMVWHASSWIALGAVLGTFGSLLASRWLGSLLFGIRANDPGTLITAALALVAVAMAAAWIPARRTAKVDPMIALRYE